MRFLLAVGVLFAADLLLAILLPSREIGAGTAERLELPALVGRSELIVEGRVLAVRALEVDGLLLSECLLEVQRTFKGAAQPYCTLRLPGGVRADGSGLMIPGVPRLVAGEETLLFLGPEGRGGMRMPTGLAQGRFHVRTEASGQKRLVRDTSALALVAGDGGTEPGRRAVLDYADVVAAIAAAAGSAGAGR